MAIFKYVKSNKIKSLFLISILLLVLFSCSPDEETQAATNTVQTISPEPEAETPEPVVVQYTLTVTAGNGGSVTNGGTFDDGTSFQSLLMPMKDMNLLDGMGMTQQMKQSQLH